MQDTHNTHDMKAMKGGYRSFAIELVLDFIIMYLVMYTMIASLEDRKSTRLNSSHQ